MAIEGAGNEPVVTPPPAAGGSPEGGTPAGHVPNQPSGHTPPAGAQGSEDHAKALKGIQADLAAERKKRQALEKSQSEMEARYKAEVEAERRRVAALAGVNVPSPEEKDAEEIRRRFAALYPDLAQLSAEDIQALREMRQEMGSLRDIRQRYWSDRADVQTGAVAEAVAKELGTEKLSDRQLQNLQLAYALRAKSDPEFLARHEAGDKTLATEFAKEWVEDWFEPVKKRTLTTEANRFRPVPASRDRSIVTQGEKKIDVNDPKAVEDVLVAGFRERGGEFGRRR